MCKFLSTTVETKNIRIIIKLYRVLENSRIAVGVERQYIKLVYINKSMSYSCISLSCYLTFIWNEFLENTKVVIKVNGHTKKRSLSR